MFWLKIPALVATNTIENCPKVSFFLPNPLAQTQTVASNSIIISFNS